MNDMMQQELRGAWLGMPRAYHLFDGLGMALGAWFVWNALDDPRKSAWVNIALGSVMIYIHSQRFFYAPQDRAGLDRLLSSLNVTRADLCNTSQ